MTASGNDMNMTDTNCTDVCCAMNFKAINYISLLIFIIGCIGNTLIIVYFVKVNWQKLRKMCAYHFLLVLLAIVDWNVCAMNSFKKITEIEEDIEEFKWYSFFEDIFDFYERTLPAISVYMLVVISFLRYQGITNPLKPSWRKRTYFLLCVLCFCFSIGLWLLNIFFDLPMYIIDPLLIGVVPLFMLCFFFYKMSRSLNNNNKSTTGSVATIANDQTRERNMIALRTVKYLIVIYFVTVVLVKIAVSIKIESNNRNIDQVRKTFQTLYLINNVANVFVYAKLIKDFRKFLLNVFTCG